MKIIPCLLAASAVICVAAQEPISSLEGPLLMDLNGSGDSFTFSDHTFSFENGQVRGKPFTAEQTTESIRVLGDGNRIVTSKKVRIVRDNEGRVRREVTTREGGEEKTSITISDPVAGVNYSLDPVTKTAHKMATWPKLDARLSRLNDRLSSMSQDLIRKEHLDERMDKLNQQLAQIRVPDVHVTIPMLNLPQVDVDLVGTDLHPMDVHAKGYSQTHEELGEDKIEGVTARGTRDTTRIPAGAIGNEKPIVILSERWFAPDLGIEVKALRSDPRYGETKVSVAHVSRTEPDPALLQVPSDYKVLFNNPLGTPLPPLPTKPKAH